jgi:dTDP-4-amino-4,6-dideoxygalactose transaminase
MASRELPATVGSMSDWIVPLADVRLSEADVQAVAAVYRGGWLSQGPRVAEFERAFADFTGARAAVAVASGTAALQLALALLDLEPDDEVILPSLTFAATAATIVRAGATPVFADVRATDAPWLSCERVDGSIGPRTRAIVNVAYAGHPGETLALADLAAARGVTLIEDAAHAAGAWAGPRHVGTIGRLGAFSFFANKNLSLGEGGMLVTDDLALAERARLLRSHGLSSGTWDRHHGPVVHDYDVVEPGFNLRLDEPRAALGIRLLERLAADNRRRGELAQHYVDAFGDLEGVCPAFVPDRDVTCAWHIFPLLLRRDLDRAAFRARMHRAGVQTSVHYPPLHMTTAFSTHSGPALTCTEEYGRRTVTVPLFPHMTSLQQQCVINAVKSLSR